MTKADRAFRAALERWRATCHDIPEDAVRKVLVAWDDGNAEDVGNRPDVAALIFLAAEFIRTRDTCPGEDHNWQHPLELAALVVRAALLLERRNDGDHVQPGSVLPILLAAVLSMLERWD